MGQNQPIMPDSFVRSFATSNPEKSFHELFNKEVEENYEMNDLDNLQQYFGPFFTFLSLMTNIGDVGTQLGVGNMHLMFLKKHQLTSDTENSIVKWKKPCLETFKSQYLLEKLYLIFNIKY